MILLIILLLTSLSEQLSNLCTKNLKKDCCEKTSICKWENENCIIKQSNQYCNSYNESQNEEQCIQDSSCAFHNGKCEHFFGCEAYQNLGANCSRISINCISISEQIVCMQKPSICQSISEMKYCGQIDHQQGSKESCEWKDNKCIFVGCEKINQQSYLSQQKCQTYHKNCKFDGFECKTQLLECSQYITNCNQIIAITGRCEFNSKTQKCINASCYNYFEDSYEKCQNHFGSKGIQCVYNKDYFEGLCLEQDYKTQVGQCMMQMRNKSCNEYLQISKCFGIDTQMYDKKIKFCLNNNQERTDCQNILNNQNKCNLIETIELKQCQWIKNSCQTINSCSDYELNLDSTEETCSNLNLSCKKIKCSKNKNGCCVQIQVCSTYYIEEECTNNSNNILNLQQACIWDKIACRQSQCSDFNQDSYQCNNIGECIFIGNKCQSRNNISCEGLDINDCRIKNCFWVSSKCYEVNSLYVGNDITKYMGELIKKIGDEDTVCQLFSDKFMYNYEMKSCHLKTACQNYSYYCKSMKQYDNTQCVNENSKCIPMTSCSQLEYSNFQQCYKALIYCNTNGNSCEYASQQCNHYKNNTTCNFQIDGSLCQWANNQCNLKQCEDLDVNNCDSINLCMDPKSCRQNMCINYNKKCITIKSRCNQYKEEDTCYKSIQNLCFWSLTSCMDFMTCKLLSQSQCQNQKYLHTCKFNEVTNQCQELNCSNEIPYYISVNSKNVTCQNQTNFDTCSQNNNQEQYSNFCTLKQVRDQIIF